MKQLLMAKMSEKTPLGTYSTREGFHHKRSGKAAEWNSRGFGKIEMNERICDDSIGPSRCIR